MLKQTKRLFSFLLALIMVLSMVPGNAFEVFAADGTATVAEENTSPSWALAKCPHCDKTIAQIDEEGGWTSWNGGDLSEATGYHYRLSKNSTSTWAFGSKTLFIDLNGKTVNCKTRLGVAGGGSNITFVDSSATSANPAGDSVIVGGNTSSKYNTSGLMVYGGNDTVADATVKIYGGNWTQAQAEGENAANAFFYVLRKNSKKSTLEIYGGRIYDCWNGYTGAIQLTAGCTALIGGNTVIEGNRATDGTGANIYTSGGTLIIQDNAVIKGGITSKGTVTLKGTPTIDKSSSETYVPTWSLRSSGKVNVSEMTGGKVYVSYSSTYKTSFSGDGAALVRNGNLVCEQENYMLAPNYEGVPVVTSQIYCVKGHTSHEGETANCEWPLMGWLNWTSTTSLPTRGHYQLENSVTEDSMTTSKDELYLNLNGQNITKTISGNGKTSTVLHANGHKVTLTDTSAQPGTVTVAPAEDVQYVTCYGTVLYVTGAAAQLNIHGGIYDGSSLYYYRSGSNGEYANAAVMAGTNASVNVYGGKIIGHKRCTVEGYTAETKGSALGGWGGTNIAIYGGEIFGGTAANGATIGTTGNLTILGGTIVSGSVTTTGSGIHIAGGERSLVIGGDAVVEDIYIGTLKSFEMHGAPQIEDLQIGSGFQTTIDATKLTTGEDGAKITVRVVNNSTRAFATIANVAQRDCFEAKSDAYHIAYNAEDSTVNLCANKFAQKDTGNGTHIMTCPTCGDTRGEAAAHELGQWAENEAKHERSCPICGYKETADHTFGDWAQADKDNHKHTCTAEGCGAVEVKGHEFSDWVAVEGTNTHKRVCSVCGAEDTEKHSFTNYTPSSNATCNGNATETAKCDECDETHTKEIAGTKLEHSFTEYVSDGNATCTENGTKTATCDHNCGAKDTLIDEGTKIAHKFEKYDDNNDATCTENGTKTAKCEYGCGTEDEVTVADSKLGHSFTNYVYNQDAVCGTDGTKTAICDRDGCEATDTVKADGTALQHKFETYEYNNDATCTANGTETATCANADCTQTDTREAANTKLGHKFGEYVYNGDATCTDDGTETAKCERCPETKTQTSVGTKLDHLFTKYVSNGDATCTEDGTKTAVCDRDGCNATDTVEEAKLGHSFTQYKADGNATCLADGTKTAKCDRCDETDTLADEGSALGHSFKDYVSNNDAKCGVNGTETAKCERCDVTDTQTDEGSAKTHTYTNYVPNGDATCTKDGTKTASCDNGCGTKDTQPDAGSKLDHSYTNYTSNGDATCTANGTKTASCDYGCGTKDTQPDAGSKLDHSYTNYTSNGDATCLADGTKTASCDYGCGTKDTKPDVGSKLEHDWTATPVNNGDDHIITCKNGCGETKTEAHDFTNGDCVCGAKEVVELPAIVAVLTAVSGNGPVTEMTGFTSLAELAKEMENYSQIIVLFGEVPQFDVTLNADLAETEDVVLEYNTNLHLNGHTFQGTIVLAAEDIVLTGAEGLDVKTTVTGGEVVFENGVHKVVTKTYVAEVDGVQYETLAAAIAAANGKTVKLLADIDLGDTTVLITDGKAVTLDLNGKTISGSEANKLTANDALIRITKGGKLTVTDSGETGAITYGYTGEATGWSGYSASTIENNQGTLVIESGKIVSTTNMANQIAYAVNALTNGGLGDATTTIKGGEIVAAGSTAVRQFANSTSCANTMVIEGGKITGRVQLQSSNKQDNKGALKITGGEIVREGNTAIEIWFAGGTSSAHSQTAVSIGGNVKVTGNVVFDSAPATYSTKVISGGTYSADVTDLCVEGFKAEKNADGTYGIVEKKDFVAEVNGQGYETLQAAVDAAGENGTVVITADIADEAVTATKSVTITSGAKARTNPVLNNVSITGSTGIELTVSNLSFTGNSWIDSKGAAKLTVDNVSANVTPSNTSATNSRSAFISLGRNEGAKLALTVTDSQIVVPSGTNPILGWAQITEANISGNTLGSEQAYQNSGDSMKFMAIADGAVFNITGNTIYSNYNGIVFAQNTTRDNAYTANISGNTFMGGADHVWVEISGGNTCHGTVLADSTNTINGNAFTVNDIKLHTGAIKNVSGIMGVDVQFNAEGKVIGGVLTNLTSENHVAEGYEKKTDGTVAEKEGLAGSGTQADPFLIQSLEDLIWFRDTVDNVQTDSSNEFLGKYFKLTTDIDLAGINWNPIGENKDHGSFKGNFDGNGHTISNLYIEQAGSYLGFFARTSHFLEGQPTTTIKNLTFHNVTVKSTNGGSYIGGVIANANAWTYLDNVKITGTVDIAGMGYIGGMVGHGYAKVNNCHVEATGSVTSTYWSCGGIVGYGGEGGTRITNSSVIGTGTDGLTVTTAAGGAAAVCGLSNGGNYFENVSAANVNVISTGVGGYNPDFCLGYIAGNGEENSTLKNMTATDVTVMAGSKVATSTDMVAECNGTYYGDLQAALNAVEEGQTIKLLRNVNVTTPAYGQNALNYTKAVNCIIDLNGKTLSANTGNSVFRFNITQSGATSDVTVTLKNGKIVAGSSTWCTVMNAGLSADVKAVFELEDLIIESSKAGDLAVKAWANGLIKAKNVTVNATNGAGGFYAVGGEIVLDNCTVNQKGLHTAPYLSMALAVSTGGKITVNSGSYTSEPTAAAEGYNQGTSHGSWTAGVMNSGGELIINGGTFTNGNFGEDSLATAARGLIFADTNGIVTVNDGTFNALKSVFDFQNNLGGTSPVITVKGGKYSADPAKVTSYGSVVIAEGFEATQDADGYYTLKRVLAGSGTQADPFLIKTVADLIFFRDSVNAGEGKYNNAYVQLTADIDLAGINWEPIGNVGYNSKYAPTDATKVFSGTFDGNGKVISNLTMSKTLNGGADAEANLGLFGITGEGAVIKNLTITNVSITTDGRNVGALVAFAHKATLEKITVNGDIQIKGGNNVSGVCAMSRYYAVSATNITVKGNDGSAIVGNNIVGGIFAEIAPNGSAQTFKDLSIENVAISGKGGVGGIVGLQTNGTVENVTVKNVAITANTLYNGDAMGRIRMGSVSGLMGSTSATIINATVENVTAKNLDGNDVELPVIGANYTGSVGNATEAKIGNTYYATYAYATKAAFAAAYANNGAKQTIYNADGTKYAELGTWGGIDWTLTADGTLTIAPTKGTPVADKNAPTKRTYQVGEWRETVVYNKNGGASSIGGAPYDMKAVKKLIIEEGVTKIGSFTCQFPNLTGEVVIPSTVTYIGQEAFHKTPITKLVFAEGENAAAKLCIANGAFKKILVEEVVLPSDREEIHVHHWAFGGCPNLKSAFIPACGTKFWGGEHVDYFDNFNAQTNVTWAEYGSIFTGCTNMETITFENEAVRDLFFAKNRQSTSDDHIVAYAGLTACNTIDAAVAIAQDGETVKLVKSVTLKDTVTVPAGKTITLDLNGKTISQSKACTASYEMINNKGNLTITGNGKISFTDTSAGDPSFGWGSYTIRNEGTLVVENGTIEHKGAQSFATHMICAIFQYSGSTTINGGTISTPNYRSVRLWKGDMTINGGTFDGQVWVQTVDDSAKLTVNGGTFEPNGNDASAVFVSNANHSVEFAVAGGTFNGKIGANDAAALAGAITGGQFSESAKNNTPAALYKGKIFTDAPNSEGYYTLEKGLMGSGTETDPYQIGTLEELILFRDSVNENKAVYNAAGLYFVLTADIDMAGINWVGIGSATADHGFMGNFDGNGYKIKNLTITNPTLDADGYAYAGLFAVTEGAAGAENVIKNLTIENVTISTTGDIVAAAIAYPYYTTVENVTVCGDINITGGNYTAGALAYTRRCVNASNVTVSGNAGSTITGKITVGGVISDIQMNGGLTANYSNFSASGLTITGEKSVGGISGIISGQTLNGATVKDVTLVCDNATVGTVAGSWGDVSTITNVVVENVTGATAVIGATYKDSKPVQAKIGDTYYATFASAYAAAQAGETITLLKPIVVAKGETLTLDKDVNIVYTSNAVGEDMITVRGTLNVAAGKITYTNTDKTGNNVTVSTISCEPGSVLNITGGTVENKTVYSTGSYAYAIDLLTNGSLGDVTATISGGEVYSDYMAIRQFNNGTACKNSLTVTGGEIYGAKRAIQIHIDNNAAELAISGGKIEAGEGGYALCLFPTTSTNIAVSGGEFKGAIYSGTEEIISGGTFDEALYVGYVAPGYMVTENSGIYGVVVDPAYGKVAKIGDTYYETLAAAFAAAKEGETVTVLAGTISEGTIKLPATLKNVTIKGEEGAILKDTTISAADGNSYSYIGLTFDGLTFDNGRILLTGWRNGEETIKDLTVTNCTFKNLYDTTSSAAVHINKDAAEAVENFTFTNNVIDGATGGSKSGVYAQVTGKTEFTGNTINNVAFRPYVIQVTTDDGIADELIVTSNTFSGSAVGRAQGLGSNASGTDTVKLVVTENIFKGITDSQQICYWNFNEETTTADLSHNYYDIDILANSTKIYFNSSAKNAADLIEMGVYPYYADEAKTELVEAPSIMVTYADGTVEYFEDMRAAVPHTTNYPKLEGATITLLKDVSGLGMRFMENGMVFDLNGHTYTLTGGTGSMGTETSGFQIRPEVTETVIIKDGSINIAEGATIIWLFNNYATNLVVEDVTVDCTNMAWAYGSQCKVAVLRSGDNVQFTGNTKIENFNSDVAPVAYTVGGTMTIGDDVVPGGAVKLDVGTTLTARAGLDVVAVDGYSVVYADGVYSTAMNVAKIGNVGYTTLAAAIAAAKDGDTIELLKDCAETVTIQQKSGVDLTIDGKGFDYTGKITVKGRDSGMAKETLTIQNVNFKTSVKSHVFIDATTKEVQNLTVQNCTFASTAVDANGAATHNGVVAVKINESGNVTVKDCVADPVYYLVNNTAGGRNLTIDNCTVNGFYGVRVHNNIDAVIKNSTFNTEVHAIVLDAGNSAVTTIENCNISVSKDERYPVLFNAPAGNRTVVIKGTNTFDDVNWFGGINDKAHVKVVLEDAAMAVPVGMVAQNGNTYYNFLQDAVNEAADGDIITVVADHTVNAASATLLNGTYKTMVNVAGKAVTVDLNGKKIYTDYNLDSMLVGFFSVEDGGNLTLIDSVGTGEVEVKATSTVYALLVSFDTGKLTVEGGTYKLDAASDSLIYAAQNETVTVNGGNFTLGNIGTGANGSPWIFNVKGQNTAHVTVTGGTFNADVAHQHWIFEVQIPKTSAMKDNGDGTWTVVEAVAYVAEKEYSGNWYINEVGYATLEEAIAAAGEGETVTLLTNVTVNSDIAIDGKAITLELNGYNVTVADEKKLSVGGELTVTGTGNVTGKLVLTAETAKIHAAETLDVASGVDGFRVEYADGAYYLYDNVNVAINLATGVKYADLQKAINDAYKAGGATVQLMNKVETDEINVKPNVTLDLAGWTLTAEFVTADYATTHIIDSSEGEVGLLKADYLSLNVDNSQIAVKTANGYRFFDVQMREQLTLMSDGRYRFRVGVKGYTDTTLAELMAANGVDALDIQFRVNIQWKNANGTMTSQAFRFSNEISKQYAADYVAGKNSAMAMYISGAQGLEELSFTAQLVAVDERGNEIVVINGVKSVPSAS